MEKKRRCKEEKLSILKEAESQGVEVTIMKHGFIHIFLLHVLKNTPTSYNLFL
jgi:hypothetical protein